MTAQLSKHLRAHMYRGGNCGKPGSFAYRRFLLEEMAEEVAVQEGFEHAKILQLLFTSKAF